MKRKPTLVEALLPIVFLIVIIAVGILKYGADPQIPLLMATIVAAALGKYLGYTWSEMEKGIVETILPATQAILIQMIIGVIIGTWIVAGIVPTMIYYGLQIISPGFFVSKHCIMFYRFLSDRELLDYGRNCWNCIVRVGEVLGIPTALTAGAIISGAYFGDKLSPYRIQQTWRQRFPEPPCLNIFVI